MKSFYWILVLPLFKYIIYYKLYLLFGLFPIARRTSWRPPGSSGGATTRTWATTPRATCPRTTRRCRCCCPTGSWGSSWPLCRWERFVFSYFFLALGFFAVGQLAVRKNLTWFDLTKTNFLSWGRKIRALFFIGHPGGLCLLAWALPWKPSIP